MATGLSVDRIVNVQVNLAPLAAGRRNFGVLCIAGDSSVIDGLERIRQYTSIEGVAEDFGLSAPEYLAAQLFFSQSPRPSILTIGRWIEADTAAILYGGTEVETDIPTWAAITVGAFKIDIDGAEASLSGINFSTATSMTNVATILDTALNAYDANCAWDGSRLVLTSATTGAAASLSYARPPASGTDISALSGLSEAFALPPVPGYDAETPAECAVALADVSSLWYGLEFASTAAITDDEHIAVAAFIEASSKSRIYGATVTSSQVLSSTVTNDLASRLKALGYDRSFVQYSANTNAVASIFGRAFTVNFNANKSTITLKFKTQPGIVAATLTETQATTLASKNCNVFVNYDNDTAIIQEGKMASGVFFDEVHGLDWLSNACQTECYNLLYQSKTKIPQTEDGVGQLVAVLAGVMNEGVNNGLIAPGVWTADGFGQLKQGDYLEKGWYIYSQPIVDQPQSEREQRKAPPIQVAVKLAGAIHFVNVQIDVNR